jgi:transposase
MLSQAQRAAILELHAKRVSKREIARVLRLSRLSVRKVLRSNSTQVPEIQRAEKAEPYRRQILDLCISCKGYLVRVHEDLKASGAQLSYPALTAFCRRQGIGQTPVVAVGQYHFEPGVEMQHDTSPHEVEVSGEKYQAQTASAVLCYSRLLFFQINPRFQRFDCKVFLTHAVRYMGGVVERVMIDNTHMVVLRGTGRKMIPVPEMEAFAERFGFRFVAHERGDANRSARVERPFAFIENNFLAGRRFASWDDLNQQARQWCDCVNSTYKKHIRAVPRELFAVERLHLQPLPAWIPEVYRLHPRMVDIDIAPGGRAAFASDHLLFVRAGHIQAQPFNSRTFTLSGDPQTIGEARTFSSPKTAFSPTTRGPPHPSSSYLSKRKPDRHARSANYLFRSALFSRR